MKMYGSYTDDDLNYWEQLPAVINVLTSSFFGAWLMRRDERALGKWFNVGSLSYRCSLCGTKSNKKTKFCHECGAKMELKDKVENKDG